MSDSFRVSRQTCGACKSATDCKLVRCTYCKALSWIDEWEIRDDCTFCPICDVQTTGYECTDYYLCRIAVKEHADRQPEKKKRTTTPSVEKSTLTREDILRYLKL